MSDWIPCEFCARPATRQPRYRHWVCAAHAPGGRRYCAARRRDRWARDVEGTADYFTLLRASARRIRSLNMIAARGKDALLRVVLSRAHEQLEARYQAWVRAARVAGGRAQLAPHEPLRRAAASVSRESSIRAAARGAGVSEATLRRFLRRESLP